MDTVRSGIRITAATAATIAVLACAACTADATALDRSGGLKTSVPTTLVMATGEGDWVMDNYANQVATLSQGALSIDVLTGDQTNAKFGAAAKTLVAAVRTGRVPLAVVPARDLDALGVSSLDALIAPFVVDSFAMQAKLLQDETLTTPMLQGFDQLGVDAVGVIPGPLVHPFGTTGPLLASSDFAGASISMSAGTVAERALQLLGAGFIVWEGNGARFDNIDGSLLAMPYITGNSFQAAGRSVTADVTLWPRPLVLIANRDALAALDEQQRGALLEAVRAAIPGVVSDYELADVESVSDACGVGMTFPEAGAANIEGLRQAVRPLIDEIGATDVGAAVFTRVEELRATTPAEPPLRCATKPDNWPTEVSDRLDGTYTTDTTAADLVAQGQSERDVRVEDWGHWTLVVKDGRFALTQENRGACTWAYGAWRMNDALVRETIDDGGGISPNYILNRPGEDFAYTWTDFGGTLALSAAMEDGPPDMSFTKVSDVPDVSAFPSRCRPPEAAFAP